MGDRLALSTIALMVVALALTAVRAADPELLVDFMPPPDVNASDLEGDFFTFKQLRNRTANSALFATVKPANLAPPPPDSEVKPFLALQGLGVSNALLIFPPGTVNRPHIHPRGTETLFIVEGSLFVGLLDSTDKLRTQTLYPGDIFVFPRGLVHFQISLSKKADTIAYASFSSGNAGLITLPQNLFGSNGPIDVNILAKSFQVDPKVIKALQAAQEI